MLFCVGEPLTRPGGSPPGAGRHALTFRGDLLDGDVPAQQLIAGQPDPAHPAFADDADQAVAPGQNCVV